MALKETKCVSIIKNHVYYASTQGLTKIKVPGYKVLFGMNSHPCLGVLTV